MVSMDAYSFVAWIASLAVYICFFLWAFSPSDVLKALGITYYPSRYYAIAIPCYVIVTYLFVNISYVAYNMLYTVDPADFRSFRDKGDHPKATTMCQQFSSGEGMPDIGDINSLELSKLWK